ncbi:hypothetical protein F2Q68_00019439 [Brassica cretica]|uniref:Arabidopsis retrotransposon Orf1 C-terminal domain-containing protein n=1 Tax=Brassica cretica TaxID=69181 RepID=A0A8S9G0N3_BRACR|nr:hypothetical protein F2Q68_00019439 [Brassica cretica]
MTEVFMVSVLIYKETEIFLLLSPELLSSVLSLLHTKCIEIIEQTVAAKKAKEQEKRAGKSIAVATDEESGDESADEQAPTKRAKMSKGKEVVDDRDRTKTPSKEELYHHLLNGVTWTPTRFADLDLLKKVGLDSDIKAMLEHLKMPKLLTMAYPAYRDVSCQFLSSLEVTYHDTPHVRQGWGKIKFKVNGREYNINFKDIGRVMGFQDLADYSLPKCENLPTQLWKLITGNKHSTRADKNSHIRHPSVRYLHRMLVHAFYPRKQAGNVTEEDMRLLCPAIRPYAPPGTLPLPSNDIYASFGMVSFFVNRLEHYRDWAWYTTDSQPKVGIGGMITPLLQFLNVPLGKDAAGPKFIDGTYLRIATYFSGMYGKDYVYHYAWNQAPYDMVLPHVHLQSMTLYTGRFLQSHLHSFDLPMSIPVLHPNQLQKYSTHQLLLQSPCLPNFKKKSRKKEEETVKGLQAPWIKVMIDPTRGVVLLIDLIDYKTGWMGVMMMISDRTGCGLIPQSTTKKNSLIPQAVSIANH